MKRYITKKGKHRSGIYCRPHFNTKRIHNRRVRFTNSCKYTLEYPDNLDINKLYGLSFGRHHNNSIRIGWNSRGEGIELYAYYYNKGKRISASIGWLECEVDYNIDIMCNQDTNTFIVGVTVSDVSEHLIYLETFDFVYPKFKWGYWLFPYFGGNNTAPKNIAIYMSK